MKLTIVITHYKEPWDIVEPLFESICSQRGYEKDELEILVVQDGEDGVLTPSPEELFPELHIRSIILSKGGVSRARNEGLDQAQGEYVMFCDCDDMFMSVFGLHLISSAIEEKPNVISSKFIEENKFHGTYRLVAHDTDLTFVHGKAFRRDFLKEHNIRFHDELTKHEDGVFVYTAIQLGGDVKTISSPFYLWVWNPDSVMRSMGVENAVLNTYKEVILARSALTEDMIQYGQDVKTIVARTIMDSYYDFQKLEWNVPENRAKRERALEAVKGYFRRYKDYYFQNTTGELAEVMMVARTLAYKNGFQAERQTIADFVKGLK